MSTLHYDHTPRPITAKVISVKAIADPGGKRWQELEARATSLDEAFATIRAWFEAGRPPQVTEAQQDVDFIIHVTTHDIG